MEYIIFLQTQMIHYDIASARHSVVWYASSLATSLAEVFLALRMEQEDTGRPTHVYTKS